MSESDGIEEAMSGQLRVLLTVAAQIGEALARAREEQLRRAEAQSVQAQRELRARFDAERAAARAELGPVHQSEWWDRATPEQIGHSYQVARAWAAEDPEAGRAEQRMRDEVLARYGVDARDTGADPDTVRQMIRLQQDRAEHDRTNAERERARAAAEEAEAARLLAEASQAEQAAADSRTLAEHEPNAAERENLVENAEQHERQAAQAREDARPLYDSAERREETAQALERLGVHEDAIGARMRTDVSQAKPATEATRGAVGESKAPKARKSRGRVAQAQKSGLER